MNRILNLAELAGYIDETIALDQNKTDNPALVEALARRRRRAPRLARSAQRRRRAPRFH
jgi:hypothetical protein